MRILILQDDFQNFLQQLKIVGLEHSSAETTIDTESDFWSHLNDLGQPLINEYLNKVIEREYFKDQNSTITNSFLTIANQILSYTYLLGYSHEKSGGRFKGKILFDSSFNHPNISISYFDEALFWKVFGDSFYSNQKQIEEKYGGNPNSIIIAGSAFKEPSRPDLKSEKKCQHKDHQMLTVANPDLDKAPPDISQPASPKVCQIVFNEETEKQELLDYIEDFWKETKDILGAWRPKRSKKRMSAPANFLRDIKIYNKYQEFKAEDRKHPDLHTHRWLRDECHQTLDMTSVRKNRFRFKYGAKKINGGK